MNASLKFPPSIKGEISIDPRQKLTGGRHIKELRQLESKISKLQAHYQHLLKQRQQDIAESLSAVDLTLVDDQTLIGGLLFLKDKITTQDPAVEDWHKAGERFFRQKKKHPKITPSQKTAPSSPAPQPPQKHPQSRDKQDEKTTSS